MRGKIMTSQDEDSDVKGEDLNVMAYFKQETKKRRQEMQSSK